MIAETILGSISQDHNLPSGDTSSKEPLTVLKREFPELLEFLPGKTVLDFGCGNGDRAAALAKHGCRVTGYDNNPHALEIARAEHGATVTFTGSPPTGSFDIVLSLDSMEHLSQPSEVLQKMLALTSPRGLVLVTFEPRGLNKMSLSKFEKLISNPNIGVVKQQYTAIRRLNLLTKIPLLRELFTNRVTVALARNRRYWLHPTT